MVEFYKKKLKNGLTVIFEKRNLPIISVALATRFGSGYEKAEEKGIAHFVEHMLFKGTRKRMSKEIMDSITEKGGEYNAFTARTLTAAWLKLPSKYLDFSVDLLADLFQNSQFDTKEMEKERGAIIEEIKMYHDTPMKHVFEELNRLMYPSPFGLPALGTEKVVSGISREQLIEKYKDNYFTENFVLVVVGDADFEDICKLGEKHFTKKEKKKSEFILPSKIKGDKSESREDLQQVHFSFGVHFPEMGARERYAAKIFSSIFCEDSSSRVYQEIREKRGLAYAIVGMFEQEKGYGECLIYVGTLKEKIELVKKIILSEFKKMKGVSEDEISKIKEKLINLAILEKEDSRNVLLNLLMEEIAGDAEEYYKYEERINSVKLEDVRKIGKLKSFSSFSLVPKI